MIYIVTIHLRKYDVKITWLGYNWIISHVNGLDDIQ